MAATEIRCPNGHFYNPSKFTSCPHCGVVGIDIKPTDRLQSGDLGGISPTVPATPSEKRDLGKPMDSGVTKPLNQIRDSGSDKPTVAYYSGQKEKSKDEPEQVKSIDPVVGWLVCIEGPDKGRDYRVKAEKNFIGRSSMMDICISGDQRVSRENHAIIAYEPRHAEFRLYPGDARGLVYLNDSMVDVSAVLHPFDKIEIGNSSLRFVPFCGEQFRWGE